MKKVYVIVTYGRGRNIRHDQLWFGSREDAKDFAKCFLDPDESVSRYTIYGE